MAVTDPRRQPIPLRPDYSARASDAARTVARAAIAAVHRARSPIFDTVDFVNKTWPDDRAVGLLLRTAVSRMPLVPGGPLATIAVHFLASLQGVSAAARLIAQSLAVHFGNAAAISIPTLTLPKGGFIAQGAAISAVQGTSSAGLLIQPHTIAVTVPLTNEMIAHSNAEQMVEQVLKENTGPLIDSLMFNANPAVPDLSPAGILNGIAALTPTTAGANKTDDMVADLEKLAASVASVSSGSIAFVAAVPRALGIQLRSENLSFPVWPSSALADGTVICLALPAVVTAVDPPMVDASDKASLNLADPASELVTVGGVVATPWRSLFQTDSTAVRLRIPASWGLRSPIGCAWMSGVSW
jgi:hypothetical protein